MTENERQRLFSCAGKKTFATHTLARRVLKDRRYRKGRDRERGGLSIYRCPVCRSWHVGSREWMQRDD